MKIFFLYIAFFPMDLFADESDLEKNSSLKSFFPNPYVLDKQSDGSVKNFHKPAQEFVDSYEPLYPIKVEKDSLVSKLEATENYNSNYDYNCYNKPFSTNGRIDIHKNSIFCNNDFNIQNVKDYEKNEQNSLLELQNRTNEYLINQNPENSHLKIKDPKKFSYKVDWEK